MKHDPARGLDPAASAAVAAEPYLQLAGIAKRFGAHTVLDQLDLSVGKASLSACWARPVAAKPPCCARLPGWTSPITARFAWRAATLLGCRPPSAITALCSSRMRCFPI